MTLLELHKGDATNQLRNEQGTDIVIPDIYYYIGYEAFKHPYRYFDPLTSVVIPDSVTLIDKYAFSGNQIRSRRPRFEYL